MKTSQADAMGRAMARSDFAKTAHEKELSKCATEAGAVLAKLAHPLGDLALNFAKKNPGAVIGGGLGALHGLMKNDGGVGSALMDGATGAAIGHGAQWAHGVASKDPTMGPKLEALKARFSGLGRGPTPISDEVMKIAEDEKVAFGALMGALSKAAPAAMNFIKSNPLKAGLGAAGALSNFSSARKSGEGLGSALLSGAAGAASAL